MSTLASARMVFIRWPDPASLASRSTLANASGHDWNDPVHILARDYGEYACLRGGRGCRGHTSSREPDRLAIYHRGSTLRAQLLLGEYAVATLAVGPEGLPYGMTAAWLSYVLQSLASCLLIFVLMVFPTGRLPSSRWRIVAWAGICVLSLGER